MPSRYARPVSDEEFVQRVRRHRPTSMLPLIADSAATYYMPEQWMNSPFRKITPWALAELARVSVLYANEYRSDASPRDLLECCAAHEAVVDWDLKQAVPGSAHRFMARLAYQQFQFQGSIYSEFGRTLALYDQTDCPQDKLQVLSGDWQRSLLGCSLTDYCGVAFLLNFGALQNHGTFDPDWIHQPQFEDIVGEVSVDIISHVISTFTATTRELRELQQDHDRRISSERSLRRFTFNALQDRPAISGVAEKLLLPSPRLLLNKASCLGLFHTGVTKFDKPFADDTGHLFEQYVGKQLKLIPEVEVLPEISFGKGGGSKSVDWIVVHEKVVLLLESKSRRPVESVRLGTERAFDSMRQSLSGAVTQVSKSANLVLQKHAAFSDVPSDRPIIGVVVTMERFHLVNTDAYHGLLDCAVVPTIVLSMSDLEQLVTLADKDPCELLLDGIPEINHGDWTFENAMSGHSMKHNPILDAGWDALPWKETAPSSTT